MTRQTDHFIELIPISKQGLVISLMTMRLHLLTHWKLIQTIRKRKKRDKNPSPAPPEVKPQVKFIDKDGVPKLKITGIGKVKIGFKLKVDDNLVTSGVFARQIDIQTDNGFIQLKRDISERVTTGRGNTTYTSFGGKEKEKYLGLGFLLLDRNMTLK